MPLLHSNRKSSFGKRTEWENVRQKKRYLHADMRINKALTDGKRLLALIQVRGSQRSLNPFQIFLI